MPLTPFAFPNTVGCISHWPDYCSTYCSTKFSMQSVFDETTLFPLNFSSFDSFFWPLVPWLGHAECHWYCSIKDQGTVLDGERQWQKKNEEIQSLVFNIKLHPGLSSYWQLFLSCFPDFYQASFIYFLLLVIFVWIMLLYCCICTCISRDVLFHSVCKLLRITEVEMKETHK